MGESERVSELLKGRELDVKEIRQLLQVMVAGSNQHTVFTELLWLIGAKPGKVCHRCKDVTVGEAETIYQFNNEGTFEGLGYR